MVATQDDSSKTELPTAKRLRDARKKGDVPKYPDIGITLGFFFALLLIWLVFDALLADIMNLTNHVLAFSDASFASRLQVLGEESVGVLLKVTALIVIPLALFALVVEFLVIGPVITAEKFKPNMSHLNPAEGLKRMFGPDNLVELFKSLIKTVVLICVAVFAVRSVIGDLMLLPGANAENAVAGIWYLLLRVFGWVSIFFFLLMFVDTSYQHHAFLKRMKMSIRDIRDELKDVEGDPMLKGARRDLGKEWSQEAPKQAAEHASVLIVNPIHIAVAIKYDAEETKIPLITGRGEEEVARSMRDAAAKAGVPVLRNEALARTLLAADNEEDGGYVPKELFDIMAEVILWAQSIRRKIDEGHAANHDAAVVVPPGEDLTDYDEAPLPHWRVS